MESPKMRAKGIYNEDGYVLVGALLILLLLIVIGIAATTSTVMEIQIAGSDRTHKETFYAADGGTQVGSELVEQAIFDFPSVTLPTMAGVAYVEIDKDGKPDNNPPGQLFVATNYSQLFLNPDVDPNNLTSANRTAYFSYGVDDSVGTTIPRTDIWVGGHPQQNVGGALQQLAGYEGKGKGAAGGGGSRLYEIHSKSYGNNNSESWLVVEWLHVL
jgi:Tfp pilus assembly protein PilX